MLVRVVQWINTYSLLNMCYYLVLHFPAPVHLSVIFHVLYFPGRAFSVTPVNCNTVVISNVKSKDKLASRPKFCPRPRRIVLDLSLEHLFLACPWTFHFGLMKVSVK